MHAAALPACNVTLEIEILKIAAARPITCIEKCVGTPDGEWGTTAISVITLRV